MQTVTQSWLTLENMPFLLIGAALVLGILLIIIIYLLITLAKKQDNAEDLHVLLQPIIDKINLTYEISSNHHQQLQQQLNQAQQSLSHQQAELKNHFEQKIADFKMAVLRQQNGQGEKQAELFKSQSEQINNTLHEHHLNFSHHQVKALEQLTNQLNAMAKLSRDETGKSMLQLSEQMTKRIDELTSSTDKRLKDISGQVEKRLADGFDKTTKTFNDILQRLALIDDAQKKITELSSNVVSLQEVLSDKRSRGAFGEVQLNALIRNVLPEQHFSLQHTLSNGKIADCVLFLPEPTGNVVVDAKFPLESYKKMMDNTASDSDRKSAERQFKLDIKKHINDISDKYLIEKETADGAVMFIPAEAIFAEIHAHQSDLVEYANKKRVWLASPTTLMAILTTARSVLKDEATRQQIHVIQDHLSKLSADFSRFKTRFSNLAKHIDQAATDVKQIHTSADKISDRFEKIEQVELQQADEELSSLPSANDNDD